MKKETKSTILTGLAMTAISGVLNPVIQAGAKAVVDHMTHDIEVSDWVYNIDKGLGTYFQDVEDVFYLDNNNHVKFKKNISSFSRTQQSYTSTIFYGGYPITIKSAPTQDKESSQISIRLVTLNTKGAIENLKRFIKECYIITHKEHIKSASKDVSVYATSRRGDTQRYYLNPFKKRTFENTFIPEEHEKIIKDSLNKFISRREWYKNNNIPYHFGFLLYGEPGHGKSVLAQAIADYIDAELIVFPGDSINELSQHIGNDIQRNSIDESAYRVICIEDVDCGFAESKMSKIWNEDGTAKNVERKVGLAEILNCLDGLHAPQNTIYVLTTNHIEKLDPALIRPGRCDVKLEVPGVTRETFIKFINYHYKCGAAKDSFQNMNFDTGITFAELQTLVMKGASIKDLCEIIENKGENK